MLKVKNFDPEPQQKPKRRDKSDLGSDFVAPDGGWGWAVCVAAGFSMFCIYAPIQQYGIIYRERMYDLGFDAKQVTTILNSELAIAAFTGIVNAPLFRRFTFRQLAIAGGFLVFLGIFLTAFCNTVMQFFICFSCIYGIGQGINLSATGLAVNTYFKTYRRRATGFSATIMGFGPIILPHVCTYFLHFYGMRGTILIVAAIALNTLACGAVLQPVLWHVKPKNDNVIEENTSEQKQLIMAKESNEQKSECKYCKAKEEEEDETSKNTVNKVIDFKDDFQNSKTNEKDSKNVENNELMINSSIQNTLDKMKSCSNCNEKTSLLNKNLIVQLSSSEKNDLKITEIKEETLTVKQRILKFFDLDLLSDITFLNLVQGISIMTFSELNSSFLMPFILNKYGYNDEQIAFAISAFASMDISVRFSAPFILDKTKLDNKVIFAVGNIILLIGRVFITIVDSFDILLIVFLLMGTGKGLRMIMGPLLIPGYVPLKRLPGASGLQLVLNAVFTICAGPILGVIADYSSYTFTIHFINALTSISLLLWLLEWLVRKILKSSTENNEVT